jgi:hypothetical protein
MANTERFYPTEKNLGKDCMFWDVNGRFVGCNFPKTEMEGRTSCEGIIDDVCLFLKDGRKPKSLTPEQIMRLKISPPQIGRKDNIPPGETS